MDHKYNLTYLVLILLIIFAIGYTFKNCVSSNYAPIKVEYHTILCDTLLKSESRVFKDSVSMKSYVHRVDSITTEVKKLNEGYQQEIDLMIYKITQWLAVWIACIAMVAGFPVVFQFFNEKKNRELLDKMQKEFEAKLMEGMTQYSSNIDIRMDIYKERMEDILNDKIGEADKKIVDTNTKVEKLGKEVSRYDREEKILSIMSCIATFPDPRMFPLNENKRKLLKSYLNDMLTKFTEYNNEFEFNGKNINSEFSLKLNTLLICIKSAVNHSQGIFSDYHQNITFYRLNDAIDKLIGKLTNELRDRDKILEKLRSIESLFTIMVESL